MPRPSVAAAACAAVALASPAAAVAAPTATPTPSGRPAAAASGFTPVALPGRPVSVASVVDGTVYVSGWNPGLEPVVVRVTRTTARTTIERVALPGGVSTAPLLSAAGGHVYAFVPGDPAREASLHDITGLTATRLTLPIRDADGSRVHLTVLAADAAGSLWVGGNDMFDRDTVKPGEVAFHGDGTTWAPLPKGDYPSTRPFAAYAVGGHYWQLREEGSIGIWHLVKEWTGDAWIDLPWRGVSGPGGMSYADRWTFARVDDYTRWGYGAADGDPTHPPTPIHGVCFHVVGPTQTPCPAPTWGVSAAVRRGDGSVVLGGLDGRGRDGVMVPGGFAVVPTPGAEPVTVPGDNGEHVTELAAAPTGSTVWAVTTSGTTATLQVMGAPRPGRLVPTPPRRTPHLPH